MLRFSWLKNFSAALVDTSPSMYHRPSGPRLTGAQALAQLRVAGRRVGLKVGTRRVHRLGHNGSERVAGHVRDRLGANLACLMADERDNRSLVGLALSALTPLVAVTPARLAADPSLVGSDPARQQA